MIKYFRQIRQRLLIDGKNSKYLKYAIGEIGLVMVGILLALQVNNWNEGRKDAINQRDILIKLREDLKVDSSRFADLQDVLTRIMSLHKELFQISVHGSKYSNIKDLNLFRRSTIFNPISKDNDPNLASKIKDKKIRDALLGYFVNIKNSDVINQEFRYYVENRLRVYLSQHKLLDVKSQFEENKDDFSMIFLDRFLQKTRTLEFQQVLFEAKVKVTSNLRFVDVLIIDNANLLLLLNNVLDQ